jgi:hypothetical protein
LPFTRAVFCENRMFLTQNTISPCYSSGPGPLNTPNPSDNGVEHGLMAMKSCWRPFRKTSLRGQACGSL